jgi:hypothetical protein
LKEVDGAGDDEDEAARRKTRRVHMKGEAGYEK